MMFNFIRSLFGKGKVRIEFTYLAGNRIKQGSLTVPYVGEWDEDDCLSQVRDQLIVEHDIVPIKMTVIGRVEG
jgi:hypothetical protein